MANPVCICRARSSAHSASCSISPREQGIYTRGNDPVRKGARYGPLKAFLATCGDRVSLSQPSPLPAFDFVLERLINDLSWESGAARFLLIVFSGVGAVGLLVGGRMADRIGRKPTTITALAIGLVGGVGFYMLDSGWFLAASIFLATLGATMLTPSFGAQRAELFPHTGESNLIGMGHQRGDRWIYRRIRHRRHPHRSDWPCCNGRSAGRRSDHFDLSGYAVT